MDLIPSEKRTELGVIPSDWNIRQIGDLNPFITSGSRGWAEFYNDYGALFVRITNLSRSSIYLGLDDVRFVAVSRNNAEAARTELQDGDMLISITADIGIIGYVSPRVVKPAYINQHIALVRFDPSEIDSKFVSYFLASSEPQRLFRALTDAGAKAGLNLTTVQQIRLALPPSRVEQKTIANALSDADAFIESLEQLIAKKRHLRHGIMHELLTGKRRLPGFEVRSGLKLTVVGAIPEDWEVHPLRSVCTLHNGRAFALHEWKSAGVPVIRLQNLTGGSEYYYSDLRLPDDKYCDKGDLLFMWSATFGPFIWDGSRAIYHYHIWKVLPATHLATRDYLYYKLLSITDGMKTASTNGGTMLHITKHEMESTPIALPGLEEQSAIGTTINDMNCEITSLEAKRAKARELKQGMMQELLTGRIRLL